MLIKYSKQLLRIILKITSIQLHVNQTYFIEMKYLREIQIKVDFIKNQTKFKKQPLLVLVDQP